MVDFRLINVTHKPCRTFNSDAILTIHAGRQIAEQKSKDGFLSNADMEWMEKNTVSDATGENISLSNRFWNEMTAIYWAWKNYDKIGSPKSIGVMHYRRHFILRDKLKITGDYLKDLGLTSENLSSLMSEYDMIHPKFMNTGKKSFLECIGEEYCTLGGNKMKQAIKLALDIIKERDEKDYDEVSEVLHSNQTGSFCNMFIMKKDLFFEYCNWIFPILFELDKRLGRDYAAGQERCIGWTAEMLTSIFIYLRAQKHSHKEVFVFENVNKSLKSFIKVFLWKIKVPFVGLDKSRLYLNRIYNHFLFRYYGKENL